jgi:radical SAM enzyme (TIGR01210 family)
MKSPTEPLFHWYVDSAVGKELVFALYTLPCRYAMCAFCSLPSLSEGGHRVTPQDIERQVDFIVGEYTPEQLAEVAKVSIYTAASTLDQECLPTRSLMYLALKVADLPKLAVVSMETRAEYVEDWELKALRNVLGADVRIELGIGYETHDPHLRNKVLGKGLSERSLRAMCGLMADNGFQLKAYVMLKPHHSLTEQDGVDEAIDGLDHLARLGSEFGIPVSVHLNPTYIAEGCSLTVELKAHGYEPPELTSILTVVREAVARGLAIYVGLDDEGLAKDGGTFRSTGLDREATVEALLAFNRHQDLDRLLAEVG